jgi:oligo-alginate lyase
MSLLPTRRAAILGAAGCASLRGAPAPATTWLLVDRAEIEAARAKAARFPWAKAALDEVLDNARRALRDPVELPNRGGQWPHWYSCPRDGVRLETVGPTDHRCGKCGTVYHGEPYDSVVLYGVHTRYARAVRDLGLAYRFTGEAKYAERAAAILLGYAERYRTYPRHNTAGEDKVGGGRIMAQTLDESVWLIPVAWGYCLVRENMPAADRRRVETDLLAAAADVIREHKMGIHNIQCWKNSAVALAGIACDRRDLVEEAVYDPARGFEVQIAKGVTEDGIWWEGSLGYHQYTMEAVWPLAEAARHAGIDLYSDRLRSLWEAPLALALPDGDSPGFNDSHGGNVRGYGSLYEIAYARWRRPEFGGVLARTPRRTLNALLYGPESAPDAPMIPEASSLLKAAGFAVLRAPGTAAAMRFGTHGGGHGHPDKLNLVTWGAGRHWGLDPGSINYGVPLHKEWYRSTIAHNTVSVDSAVQANTDGQLGEWKAAAGETTLRASADTVYPGVRLGRTVTLRKDRIEDRFDCASETERTYDWAFHAAGRFSTSLALAAGPGKLGDGNGYQHVEKVSQGETDGAWWARWEADGARLTLQVKAAPGTTILTGVAPGTDPADRVPMVIIRRRGKAAVFEVTHRFERAG